MSDFSDISTLIRYRHCTELMDRMLERTGANPAEAVRIDGGVAWLEARTNCFYCRDVEKCSNWLEGAAATPADFCRNNEFFRSCAISRDNAPITREKVEGLPDALSSQEVFLDPNTHDRVQRDDE